MVHVFKVALFLVILLFTLASAGFSDSDDDSSSESSYSEETSEVDSGLETNNLDTYALGDLTGDDSSSESSYSEETSEVDSGLETNNLDTDVLGELPKTGAPGKVTRDEFCVTADIDTYEILAPEHIWENMKSKASDCSNFGTDINCKPSGLGGCKPTVKFPAIIVGPTAPADSTVYSFLQHAMSLKYTLTPDLFEKMAEDGCYRDHD